MKINSPESPWVFPGTFHNYWSLLWNTIIGQVVDLPDHESKERRASIYPCLRRNITLQDVDKGQIPSAFFCIYLFSNTTNPGNSGYFYCHKLSGKLVMTVPGHVFLCLFDAGALYACVIPFIGIINCIFLLTHTAVHTTITMWRKKKLLKNLDSTIYNVKTSIKFSHIILRFIKCVLITNLYSFYDTATICWDCWLSYLITPLALRTY